VLKSFRNDPQQFWIDKFVAESKNQLETTAHLRALWWKNPTNRESLRLSHQGFHWVSKNTAVPNWPVRISQSINGKQLIQLERVFKSPYFLSKTGITVFSEEDFIMLQLHAGDLAQYLNNLQL
jgi:hypothetical protein